MDKSLECKSALGNGALLGGQGPRLVQELLRRKVAEAAARPLPKSAEELEADKPRRRRVLMQALGLDPPPPRTPLNARITGTIQLKGYRIEKLVYESRPGFYVTAHLYLPDGPAQAKLPVILNPHGHWPRKKMEPVVQARLISQALCGYAALAVDSPGGSWEGDNLVERTFQGSHWDFPLASAGANATALYVWDLMRGLDYLETRPECDASRVGITGASGGGLAAVYAFAADERIGAAVPAVYASSLEVNPVNGCPCNHVPGTLQIGDRSDVLAIRAPAPVLVLGAEDDPEFPPEGIELTGRKLKAVWGLYGKAGDAEWQVFPGSHDYGKAMRERALGFLERHLKGVGDGSPVPEPELALEDPADPRFLCLPEIPQGAKTMRDIARENLSSVPKRGFDAVVALNGGLPRIGPATRRFIDAGGPCQGVLIETGDGLTVPGLLWKPAGRVRGGAVLVSDHGKHEAFRKFDIGWLLEAGFAALALDPRGIGELRGLDVRLMTYLGTAPSFAMAGDVCAAALALRTQAPKVALVGAGPAAAQAVLFAALMDPKIEAVAGLNGMRSYLELLDLPTAQYEPNGLALQPRADCGTPLEHLRSLVASRSLWTFGGELMPNLAQWLAGALGD